MVKFTIILLKYYLRGILQLSTQKPKYQIMQEWLREQIVNGVYQPEQRIPTEFELADQFGYSRQTIRQAVSALEHEGIITRTRGKGTFVCVPKPVKKCRFENRIRKIGVLTTYLDDYIFPGIINGIEQVLTRNGCLFTLGLTRNKTFNEATVLKQLLDAGIDGLIIEGTKSALPSPNEYLLQKFRDMKIPIVFVNGCYCCENDSYVAMDDVKSGEMMMDFLKDYGHTKIGGIFKSDDIQGRKRYEGVLLSLQKCGKQIYDDHVLWYTTEDVKHLFEGMSDEMLLKRFKGVSAVICYNDEIAIKLIEVFRRNGVQVPEDISVCGFDDAMFSSLPMYDLTTIVYPSLEIGAKVANVMLQMLDKPDYKVCIKLSPELKIRKSVVKRNEC